jgi:hypothetical protein
MRPIMLLLVVVGLLGVVGCELLEKRETKVTPPPLPPSTARVKPVKASEITTANARQKLKELKLELDRDIDGELGE